MDKEELELRAKLQQKKSALRKELSEKGVLQKDKANTFDGYKYFSEAAYKQLFTELLPKHNLELSFSELSYIHFAGVGKQAQGRMVKLQFILSDTETGYFEESVITAEGMDKGDKAGYKAYTGALKYYFANTFMVATGDDPENPDKTLEEPKEKKKDDPRKADLINRIKKLGQEQFAMQSCKANSLEEITVENLQAVVNFVEEQQGGIS